MQYLCMGFEDLDGRQDRELYHLLFRFFLKFLL